MVSLSIFIVLPVISLVLKLHLMYFMSSYYSDLIWILVIPILVSIVLTWHLPSSWSHHLKQFPQQTTHTKARFLTSELSHLEPSQKETDVWTSLDEGQLWSWICLSIFRNNCLYISIHILPLIKVFLGNILLCHWPPK